MVVQRADGGEYTSPTPLAHLGLRDGEMERAPRMNASLCPSLPTFWALAALLTASISAVGCKDRSSDSDDTAPKPEWTILGEALPGALLSVTGRARDDVWTVGGDDGEGPLVRTGREGS